MPQAGTRSGWALPTRHRPTGPIAFERQTSMKRRVFGQAALALALVAALPQAATMLGLLGTVLGMIRTFTVVAASADSLGKTERLAQGIHEAWTATAGGLIVAIPTLLAYHIIMARIDAAAAALDHAAALWLNPGDEPLPASPARSASDGQPHAAIVPSNPVAPAGELVATAPA